MIIVIIIIATDTVVVTVVFSPEITVRMLFAFHNNKLTIYLSLTWIIEKHGSHYAIRATGNNCGKYCGAKLSLRKRFVFDHPLLTVTRSHHMYWSFTECSDQKGYHIALDNLFENQYGGYTRLSLNAPPEREKVGLGLVGALRLRCVKA